MAFLLLQHRRRTRLTAQDFDHLRSELENAKATLAALEQFKQEQQRDLDDLRHRLELHRAQAEQTNKHLAEQNRQLRDQVERLRAAKERLEKLQEEKDELLSILIHDIKNP
jgi:chromosome segregation ATPase